MTEPCRVGANPSLNAPALNPFLQRTALVSLLGLLVLCVLWETWLAPLRPGGTLLFLKALPLAFAVRGVARGSLYTLQWASMLVLLYLMEGVVRVMSDPPGPSIVLAALEIVLSSTFFLSAIFYVRPAKRVARQAAKAANAANAENAANAANAANTANAVTATTQAKAAQ